MRYANGHKAKRALGYEARVGLDEAVRISCGVRTGPSWIPLYPTHPFASDLSHDLGLCQASGD